MTIFDGRTKHHKGRYVLFWCSRVDYSENIEIYSSKRATIRELNKYPYIYQVMHDSSGNLVAYSKNGKVVIL